MVRYSEQNRMRVKVEDTVVEEHSESETVQLILLKNVNLKIIGSGTGKEYYFPGAGSVADVDILDVPGFLSKKSGSGCSSCSGLKASNYFAIAQ